MAPDINFKKSSWKWEKTKGKAFPEKNWLYCTVRDDGRLIGTAGHWRLCGRGVMQSTSESFYCRENSGCSKTRLGWATTTSLSALCPDLVCVKACISIVCVSILQNVCVVSPSCQAAVGRLTARPFDQRCVETLWGQRRCRLAVLYPPVTFRSRCEIARNLRWLCSRPSSWFAAVEHGGKKKYIKHCT